MRKTLSLLIFLISGVAMGFAQMETPYNPFQGINLGITSQIELVKPVSMTNINGYTPRTSPGFGCEGGLELSYHFAKYFGVSVGLNFGTASVMRYHVDWEPNSDMMPWNTINRTLWNAYFPVKFEFHYPVGKNFWLMSDLGVKFSHNYYRGTLSRYSDIVTISDVDEDGNVTYTDAVWNTTVVAPMKKTLTDLVFDMGFYYQLPYGDLLRFSAGLNAPLYNFLEGDFTLLYPDGHETGGNITSTNTHLNFSAAYIHTFKRSKLDPFDAWKWELPRHEFQFNIGDPMQNVQFSYLYRQHKDRIRDFGYGALVSTPGLWTQPLEDYTVTRYVPVFSFSYHYRAAKWFWVGGLSTFSGLHTTYRDRLTDEKTGGGSEFIWTIMPAIRFSYLNREHVTLYSGAAFGLLFDHIRVREYQGSSTLLTYHLTGLGVKAGGKHWFGDVEVGYGYKGVVSAGFGYQF